MNEDFLHFLWENELFIKDNWLTNDNQPIVVKHLGTHNTNAGADFLNALISIDSTLWAGDVEFHFKASDWYRHNHHKDPAYNSVILHVVYENDQPTYRQNKTPIPTATILFDQNLLQRYQKLANPHHDRLCLTATTPPSNLSAHLSHLLDLRLLQKEQRILASLKLNNSNWEETLYQTLASNLTMNMNTTPMQLLTAALPLHIIQKHQNQLFQIEALIFGQAGMLQPQQNPDLQPDDYFLSIQKEYKFLSHKYDLTPINPHIWKFLRLRPSNFPTIRLAQLSALLHKNPQLFSLFIEASSIQDIFSLCDIQPSDYWTTHYNFSKPTSPSQKRLGKAAIHTLICNTIVPFLFCYGKARDRKDLQYKAYQLLHDLPPEHNHIVSPFLKANYPAKSTADTQAYLYLNNNYCMPRKCTSCFIGQQYLLKHE